jgi:hypothetical protein
MSPTGPVEPFAGRTVVNQALPLQAVELMTNGAAH